MIAFPKFGGLSPAARAYATGIARLHELELAGALESPDAEEVRDSMDLPWRYLNARERDIVGLLSESLNASLETISRPSAAEEALLGKVDSLISKREVVAALQLIFENESKLTEVQSAFLKGLCWWLLEVPEATACFYRHAYQHSNAEEQQTLLMLLIGCLISLQRFAEANQLATDNIDRELRPEVRLKLAEAIIAYSLTGDRQGATASLNNAVSEATDALSLLKSAEKNQTLQSAISAGYLWVAFAWLGMERETEAKQACQQAIQNDPTNVDALALWGQFTSDVFPKSCRESFLTSRLSSVVSQSDEAPPDVSLLIN